MWDAPSVWTSPGVYGWVGVFFVFCLSHGFLSLMIPFSLDLYVKHVYKRESNVGGRKDAADTAREDKTFRGKWLSARTLEWFPPLFPKSHYGKNDHSSETYKRLEKRP